MEVAARLSCSHGKHRENTFSRVPYVAPDPVHVAVDRRESARELRNRLKRLQEIILSRGGGTDASRCGYAVGKLSVCGAKAGEFRYGCGEHGVWHRTLTCKHPLCPVCASKRRGRLLGIYEEHVTAYRSRGQRRAVMVTLTQPTRPEEDFRSGVTRLRRFHRRFTQLLKKEIPGVGGVTTYEGAPRPGKTWHVHAHILLNTCHIPDGWTHPRASATWRPINQWRIRALWAIAHCDRRTWLGKTAAAMLSEAAAAGYDSWAAKIDQTNADHVRAAARAEEDDLLFRWAKLCALFGIPAVADVRAKHPSEALKYITKGFSSKILSNWHLLDLLRCVPGMRRTDAWGALYHLQKSTDDDQEEDADAIEPGDFSEPCPCCRVPSLPLSALDDERFAPESRPDWLLRAMGQRQERQRRSTQKARAPLGGSPRARPPPPTIARS